MLSLVFLAVTIISGPVHDYLYYLFEWYKVRQGDPWFIVIGPYGRLPLNAYGPLFNLLAVLELVNPLAPKLLFAYAYILFCLWQFKEFAASHRLTGARTAALTALFWNPFPWVEIAIRGHFDILVAVFCVGALRARTRGSDFRSGISLALGVLLKFFPVVLLPFLAFETRAPPSAVAHRDRGDDRPRHGRELLSLGHVNPHPHDLCRESEVELPVSLFLSTKALFAAPVAYTRSRHRPVGVNHSVRGLGVRLVLVSTPRSGNRGRLRRCGHDDGAALSNGLPAESHGPLRGRRGMGRARTGTLPRGGSLGSSRSRLISDGSRLSMPILVLSMNRRIIM